MKVTAKVLRGLTLSRQYCVFRDDKLVDVIIKDGSFIVDVNSEPYFIVDYLKPMKGCTIYLLEDIKPPKE